MEIRTVAFKITVSNVPDLLNDDNLQINIREALVDYGDIHYGDETEFEFFLWENVEIEKESESATSIKKGNSYRIY